MKKIVLLLLTIFNLAAVANTSAPFGAFVAGDLPFAVKEVDVYVRVLDAKSLQPLENAVVMIGSSEGQPFAENLKLTNETGEVVFNDDYLKNAESYLISATANGYHKLSVYSVKGNFVELLLHQNELPEYTFQAGRFTNFPTGYNSKTFE